MATSKIIWPSDKTFIYEPRGEKEGFLILSYDEQTRETGSER